MVDKMVTAVRVDVDGTAAVIELAGTEERGVGAALRAALDCQTFDLVRIGPGLDMWIDEEGLLVGEPVVNRVATLIAKAHGFVWQRYVGAVVFTSVDDEGETQSLREGQVEALLTTARLGGAVVVDATVDEAGVGA
ncbi:DUF3846 domain-containing protein (plasmid) [Rhodococcus aetherivorans]|uniref:DUF3846 domain-containing protein n=1 Tax=Rhodococcus aetherivorans TaxID=191292 RepID=UPI0026EA86E3|nr:DUF3846 domain-containing protein [Rhodococcus aetherivorans]WKX01984.1 DUF3846 domain-containing protein [Rhodococcus aetherivorans]